MATAATSRKCPWDRAHRGRDCNSDESNDKLDSSESGQPSRGTAETRTSTGPDHPAGAPPTHHPHLAQGESLLQQWKDAVITVLHKKGDKTECRNYRSISLVSHAGEVLLKVVGRRIGTYCEAKELLPEEQYGFRPDRSTTDMMFVVRRLQEIGRKAGVSFFVGFIDIQKALDTVDRTLLWEVLTRIGVPSQMIAVIQQIPRWDESLRAT